MLTAIAPYRKMLAHVAGTVVMALVAFQSDDVLTAAEILQVILAVMGTVMVYALPNMPGARFVKLAASAVSAGLVLLIPVLESGEPLTNALWLNVVFAVGSVLGVLAVDNEPEPAVPPTANTFAVTGQTPSRRAA